MPQITANIKTDESVKEARRRAINKGVSLRNWAGEIIEAHIAAHKPRKARAK